MKREREANGNLKKLAQTWTKKYRCRDWRTYKIPTITILFQALFN